MLKSTAVTGVLTILGKERHVSWEVGGPLSIHGLTDSQEVDQVAALLEGCSTREINLVARLVEDAPKPAAWKMEPPFPPTNPPSAPPPVVLPSPFDDGVFGAMNSLTDVIKEVIKQGAVDYLQVCARVHSLRETGSCPRLTRMKPAELDESLYLACVKLQVPGAI